MKLTMVIHVDDIDQSTLEWIESLIDKAREQGSVDSCIMTEVPSTIDFGTYL